MNKLKNIAINKIIVSTLCLVLLSLFYLIPTHENINTLVETNEEVKEKNVVYLLDKDNYVSKLNTYFNSDNIEDNIRKRINILINGSNDLINFYNLIPQDTKLNSVKVIEDKVYLDFSKEILKINKYLEESMIEAIIYTVTDINGINDIYISVDGNSLTELPNSKKKITEPLNRHYGINKEYDIDNLNNIERTTIYFSKSLDELTYFIPITKINNDESEKINIIIKELKSSVNSQNNLNSIDNNLELKDYKKEENVISLTFNNYIFDNNAIMGEVEECISESIFENYNVKEIVFNSDENKNIRTIFKN